MKGYFILKAFSTSELAYEVEKQMARGYRPLGGVTVIQVRDHRPSDPKFTVPVFFQAMTSELGREELVRMEEVLRAEEEWNRQHTSPS